jgi:WD40 repeat protein
MAVKSEQMRTDTLLKGLLAFQSYSFNNENEGVLYDPDIFKSAYSGLRFFKGADFNVYKGHTSIVRTMVLGNESVITGGSDGLVISWDINNNTSKVLLSNLPIVKKLLIRNQTLICLTNNSIIKYDLNSAAVDVYSFQNIDIKDFFISKSGKFIMVYNESLAITDDYKTQGTEFYKTEAKINAAKYDYSSGNLFVALSDGKIFYWKNFMSAEEKPTLLANIPDGSWGEISYNPAKNIVAAGTGNNQGAIYLWDLETGKQASSLRGHTAKITGIGFSTNGALMATASYDGSVRIWHLDDLNTLPVVFDDHATWVTSIMFTGDSKYVISGDKSGNLRTLPTEITTIISDYCGFLTRDLTENEWQNYVGTDIDYKPTKCNNK